MKNKESIIEKDLSKVVSCGVEIIDSLFDLNDNKGFEPGYTMIMSEKKYNKELITCDIANSISENVIYCNFIGYVKDNIKKKYKDMIIKNMTGISDMCELIKQIVLNKDKDEKCCIILNINHLIKAEKTKSIREEFDISDETSLMLFMYSSIKNFMRINFKLLYDNNIFLFILSNIETKTSLNIHDDSIRHIPPITILKQNETIQGGHSVPYFSNTIFRLDDYTLTLMKSQYSSLKNKVCKML